MRIGFLRTRFGRRYLGLFLLAALVPVIALATFTYFRVRADLLEQAHLRVERLTKSVSLASLSSLTRVNDGHAQLPPDARLPRSVALFVSAARLDTAFGVPRSLDRHEAARPLWDDDIVHLRSGRPLLTMVTLERDARVYLARAVNPQQLDDGILWVRVNPVHLWSTVDELVGGEGAAYCIFDGSTRQRVRCSPEATPAIEKVALSVAFARADAHDDGDDRLEHDGRLTATRDLYLRYEFGAPEWRVVVLEPSGKTLAPLRAFTLTFISLLAATLGFVFLIAHVQIRRSTEPLLTLRNATSRIAAGDMSVSVAVQGTDELGDLAASFNGMAGALERQLSFLHALDRIDRTVLATRESDSSIGEAALQLSRALPEARVMLSVLIDRTTGETAWSNAVGGDTPRRDGRASLSAEEQQELRSGERHFVLRGRDGRRAFLPQDGSWRSCVEVLVLPLIHDELLIGVLALGYERPVEQWTTERERARRLADRVTLGLANVLLVRHLDGLSNATITAFARAIDANSPWTAGHSERVTDLAMEIGRRMSLPPSEMETLYRGALLHDVGKIGVPPSILDKSGPLTEDEWEVMKRHPTLGAQILAPLAVFADAIPLVLHHHERFDGTGYPARLAGHTIPKLARLLAVADAFDAITSKRPYRKAMTLEEAMDYVRNGSGSHFDPEVVTAMLAAHAAGAVTLAATTSAQRGLASAVDQGRRDMEVAA